MSTAIKLNNLNTLRVMHGMNPLKSWKESVAKLDAAIAKLSFESTPAELAAQVTRPEHTAEEIENTKAVIAELKAEFAKDEPVVVAPEVAHPAKKLPKQPGSKERAKKAADTKARNNPPADNTFTIADLAREMNKDPKQVRAKARKLGLKHDGRWTFAMDRKDEIAKLLK